MEDGHGNFDSVAHGIAKPLRNAVIADLVSHILVHSGSNSVTATAEAHHQRRMHETAQAAYQAQHLASEWDEHSYRAELTSRSTRSCLGNGKESHRGL